MFQLSSQLLLFILQFLLAAAYAVTDIPLGVATLMCTLFAVVLLIAYGMHEKIDWSESRNGMLMLFLIWGVYCILEIANPNNVQAAWNISITHYLIYPIVCAVNCHGGRMYCCRGADEREHAGSNGAGRRAGSCGIG